MRACPCTWMSIVVLVTGLACGPSQPSEAGDTPPRAQPRDEQRGEHAADRPGRGRRAKQDRPLRRARDAAAAKRASASSVPSGELLVAVRVHLSNSESFRLLDSTMSEAEATQMIAAVNEIWAPAQVRFELDSVVSEQALAAEAYAEHVAAVRAASDGDGPSRADKKLAREATLPTDQRIAKGIDIYVHRSLISAGGVFTCPARAVVFGQFQASKHEHKDGDPNPAAVLAHELGHALGLPHVPCAEGGNLMMAACSERDPELVGLTDEQIAIARSVAATGEPRSCDRDDDDDDDEP